MTDERPLLVEREGDVAVVTFDRPEKLNALSSAMLDAFDAALDEVEADRGTVALLLRGAGDRAFVAGADIAEYAGQSAAMFAAYQRRSRTLFGRVDAFPKPVVAAVHGHALGGGFEIALCCDVVVASPAARFGLPEGSLGLSPGGGGTQRLTRAVGPFVAADVLLAGRRLNAEEAWRLGLVSDVVDEGQLRAAALEKARAMARIGPLAFREMKRLIALAPAVRLEDGLDEEHAALLRLFATKDAREGIAAFVEKRQPRFEGA